MLPAHQLSVRLERFQVWWIRLTVRERGTTRRVDSTQVKAVLSGEITSMYTSSEEGAGLLLAMMEPSPTLEQEFQSWYDSEHFPEREGTEGFLTATRLVCVDGWPRYLALYDLENVGVLRGSGYAKIAGENYSRWTHRIIPHVWGHYRAEGVQVAPGRSLFGANGRASRVALWRFHDVPRRLEPAIRDGLESMYGGRAETAQIRLFRCNETTRTDYVGIVELYVPYVPGAEIVESLGEARKHIDLVNIYTRYFRI